MFEKLKSFAVSTVRVGKVLPIIYYVGFVSQQWHQCFCVMSAQKRFINNSSFIRKYLTYHKNNKFTSHVCEIKFTLI